MNEVLYLKKEDQVYLRYLYLIRDAKKEAELNQYQIDEFSHLLTYEEVINNSIKEDIKNMEEIDDLCNISFSCNKDLLPKYNDDKDFNATEYLKALSKKGLEKRCNNDIPYDYKDRLKYELDVIHKMGFDNYFLVVWDFIKYAKKNNILSNCRGSAAGSLVSYSLGITDIDSIKYNLFFERFLNPERISMPDIDIDFDSEQRAKVVSYVINKYGKKRAMPIITFVTLGGRQVLRDIGRILDINPSVLDNICKMVNPYGTLSESIDGNPSLKNLLIENKTLSKLYTIASALEGGKRQISVHAAGIVISEQELDSYIPLQKYDDYYITGYSMEHLEELGLLKMDFLGLRNLTLLDNVVKDINKNEVKKLDLNDIPLDDNKTLSIFSNAYTDGIFQFESAGIKNFIRKLKPSNFEEIIAAVALFRPGPMDNIDHYIKRKFGKEKIDYIHPDLVRVLESTYGIIIYQEQIMQTANIMAGYSMGEADVLRRAMSKKKKEILESEQSKFISRSIEKGYSKEIATNVYNLILKFANYGFNRAHSVSYSLIAYKMAYLKAHYPSYFMSALLTNAIGNDSKTKDYIEECKVNNINILKPDINASEYNYKVEELGIRFSLATIRNVGSMTCKEIVKAREAGPFIDFFDFVGRTYGKAVTKKSLEALIDAGCFNVFGYNHKTLHHNLPVALNYADLVRNINLSLIDKPIMEIVNEYDKLELTSKELDAFGFYLDNHPTNKYKGQYSNLGYSNKINTYFDKKVTPKKQFLIIKFNNDKLFLLKINCRCERLWSIQLSKKQARQWQIITGNLLQDSMLTRYK
jgi:DNA polymerase-3 subunit alpha